MMNMFLFYLLLGALQGFSLAGIFYGFAAEPEREDALATIFVMTLFWPGVYLLSGGILVGKYLRMKQED